MTDATFKLEALLKSVEDAARVYLPFESALTGYNHIKEAFLGLEDAIGVEPVTIDQYEELIAKTNLVVAMAILLMFDLTIKKREVA
jgi:hypothetical protein